jgi:hypothetical protein
MHGLKIESTKTEVGDRVYQIRKYAFQLQAATCEGWWLFTASPFAF